MPNVFFRSKPMRVAPSELAERLAAALEAELPGAGIDVAAAGGDVALSWEDGPAAGTVADVVAGVVNWEVRTPAAAPTKAGAPSVVLDRRFSDRALAVAVVRYQASHVRPYHSSGEGAVAGLVALLEVEDPARSGYPVPDTMAELLLEADDPDDLDARSGSDPSPADRLAAKLTALGYDRLWEVAWSRVT